ncbi:flagellar brake domain-containing protein [Sporosarcina oncorhynchi]|uniref:Flagellar brake domain-containing protein n=1 Tax=Sporosarcina oncorhynchi TaxID=3056444 RepID=A0ABZ0L035_9BACL|nr:flagellar brake domain-containing protein [Sporosarcina sp. T2O-4]WOV85989.1 flagellar brake domain-containing protein [Sporosarcina sp. T2O-4]
MRLKVGTTVIIDKDYTENGDKYKSKVVDAGDDYVMIDYPAHIETNRTAFFMDGTQLLISFVDNKMSFAFRAEVTGRMNKGIPMLKLSYPGDEQLIKIQRREFVRVETAIDVAVNHAGVSSQFVAEDISAGGIALNLGDKEVFEESDIVNLSVVLPYVNDDIKYVRTEAQAVRIWEKDGRRIASMQFSEIDTTDRQNIIRFCFERQLQHRNEK